MGAELQTWLSVDIINQPCPNSNDSLAELLLKLGLGCIIQCSAKALEKWGQMTHTTEKYGDIGYFLGVTYVILSFVILKLVGTWAPTAKIIGDIPDFNVLNVPKMQPRHNPDNWIPHFYKDVHIDAGLPCLSINIKSSSTFFKIWQ